MLGTHAALIYTMVITSAADREMTDEELQAMGSIVRSLPAFRDFNVATLPEIAGTCADLLQDEDSLDGVLDQIRDALPANLRETAYALALEIVAVDLEAKQEELRILELLRHRLQIDRLVAAAMERGTRARYQTVHG